MREPPGLPRPRRSPVRLRSAAMTVALVTGSNSGIGRGAAVELARRGWTVYGSMRSLDKGDKLAGQAAKAGVEVHPVVLDVTDAGSVQRAVAEITAAAGQIDVLVNNAGVGGNGVTEECSIEQYEQVMDANVYGPIRLVQAVLPQMRERRPGTIVNISSVVGRVAHIGQSPYYVSKWALEAMSEGLAQEVAPFGIRVCVVEPGITRSAIFAKNIDAPNATGAYDAAYARMFQFYAAGIPNATPAEDVAAVIHGRRPRPTSTSCVGRCRGAGPSWWPAAPRCRTRSGCRWARSTTTSTTPGSVPCSVSTSRLRRVTNETCGSLDPEDSSGAALLDEDVLVVADAVLNGVDQPVGHAPPRRLVEGDPVEIVDPRV